MLHPTLFFKLKGIYAFCFNQISEVRDFKINVIVPLESQPVVISNPFEKGIIGNRVIRELRSLTFIYDQDIIPNLFQIDSSSRT